MFLSHQAGRCTHVGSMRNLTHRAGRCTHVGNMRNLTHRARRCTCGVSVRSKAPALGNMRNLGFDTPGR